MSLFTYFHIMDEYVENIIIAILIQTIWTNNCRNNFVTLRIVQDKPYVFQSQHLTCFHPGKKHVLN